jgi:F-box interacting protein
VFRTPTEKGQSDIYLFELEPGLEQVMKFNYTKASLPNRSRLALVGSCNGLLCLYDLDSMKSLYVVNPMTSEYVQTPPKLYKERRHAGTLVDAVHGFGFSPVTNQYKVIRVFEKVLSHPNVHHESLGEIFTLGTNKWRSIGKTPFPANKEFFGVPLNGAIH